MHPTEQFPEQGHRVTLAQQHWSKTEHPDAYDAGIGLRGSEVVVLDLGQMRDKVSGLSKSETVLTFKAFDAAVVLFSNMHPFESTQ